MLVEKTFFRSTKAQRIAQRINGNREKKGQNGGIHGNHEIHNRLKAKELKPWSGLA
jgi:hypothetical protein